MDLNNQSTHLTICNFERLWISCWCVNTGGVLAGQRSTPMWLWQLIQIMLSKFFGDNQTIKVSPLSDLSSLQSNTQFSAALWTRSSTAAMTVTGDWPIVIKFVSSVLWKLSKNDLVPHFRGFTIPMDVPAGCYILLSICTYPVSKIHLTPKYEQAPRAPLIFFYARQLFIYVANFLFALVGSLHFLWWI